MSAPLKLRWGMDDVVFEDISGSVSIDIQPWRDYGASAYLDFSDAKALRDWLNGWLAENAPAEPEA